MNDDTVIEKPSLDALLNQDLHDLINATANKFYTIYGKNNYNTIMISKEDLSLEGYLGATTAYQSFNPVLGFSDDAAVSFRTHAYLYINNAMLTYCRKFSHPLSISEKSARNDWGEIISIGVVFIDEQRRRDATRSFDETMFDIPVGSGVDVSHLDIESYFLAGFSSLERNLVKDHFIDGCTLRSLSKRYQLSWQRIGEIVRKLRDRLRERVKNYVQDN